MTDLDREVVDRLLTTTRAVRRRLDTTRPVEREVVLDCIRLAQQAPTAGNSQNWRWLVVDDPELRRGLAELYRQAGEEYLRGTLEAATEEQAQTRRVYASAVRLLDVLADVPVHVIPCLEGRPPAAATGGNAAGFFGSIFPAVWSFQLALRSRGLGTVLTTLHLQRQAEAAALLGIPDGVTQVALLPVAYYTGSRFRPAERPPVETIVHLNGW